MIIFIYTVIMALLISSFVLVAALLRTYDNRQPRRKRKKKYNLKK